jgi:hypothetical protein
MHGGVFNMPAASIRFLIRNLPGKEMPAHCIVIVRAVAMLEGYQCSERGTPCHATHTPPALQMLASD